MGRPCLRCEESFHATGKACKICETCINISHTLKRARMLTTSHVYRIFHNMDKIMEQEARESG